MGKKVKRKFTFDLTDKDKFKLGVILATKQVNMVQLEDALFGMKKEYRMKIEDIRKEIRDTTQAIVSGKEEREVLVEEVMNFDERLVNSLYQGKVIHSRPMTEEEAQLDFEGIIQDPEKFEPTKVNCQNCDSSFMAQHRFQRICENCKKIEGYRFAQEA